MYLEAKYVERIYQVDRWPKAVDMILEKEKLNKGKEKNRYKFQADFTRRPTISLSINKRTMSLN